MNRLGLVLVAFGLVSVTGEAHAFGVGVAGASDTEGDTQSYQVFATLNWEKDWFKTGNWHLNGYSEGSLAYWDGKKGNTGNDGLVDVGLTPFILHWEKIPVGSGWFPFVGAGVGLHILSEQGISDQNMGQLVQFGSHFDMGVRFGQNGHYGVGYRFQHLSNAGINDDNDGINLNYLRFTYYF